MIKSGKTIARISAWVSVSIALAGLGAAPAAAQRPAILNYETKAEESLESLQVQAGPEERREGIAIIETDPDHPDYGQILIDIPVDPTLVTHHIFYNKDLTKAYITALGQEVLHVIDLTAFPYRLQPIPTPGCNTQENIIFSDDNKTWWVTCMGSENLAMGDAETDQMIKLIDIPGTYPHGITLHEGIDRLVVANCVAPDMSGAGHTAEILRASTGEYLGAVPVSDTKGTAPVEAVFVPGTDPPIAYVTVMMEDTLWALVWEPESERFTSRKIFDFSTVDAHMPLEIYFNRAVDKAFVTTAEPGHFHVFDISESPLEPKLIKQFPAAGGAHHVAFTLDEKRAYVQNSLLNLPGISDGSITVIDLEAMAVIDSIDVFKDQGLTPNSITMLPAWYHPAGHFNNAPEDY